MQVFLSKISKLQLANYLHTFIRITYVIYWIGINKQNKSTSFKLINQLIREKTWHGAGGEYEIIGFLFWYIQNAKNLTMIYNFVVKKKLFTIYSAYLFCPRYIYYIYIFEGYISTYTHTYINNNEQNDTCMCILSKIIY